MSSEHDALLSSYMVRNQDKLNKILESWTGDTSRLINMQQLPSLVSKVIRQYLAIPKVSNLLEFSFLLNNTINIKPQGWKSLHYRGENKRYQHPCKSSYFRINQTKNSTQEIEEVNEFKNTKIGKEIQARLSSLNLNQDHYYWWFLTQHHSEKGKIFRGSNFQTRLLDVSKNPYVALFFSCLTSKEDDIEDGYVYIFQDLETTEISKRPPSNSPQDKLNQFNTNPYTTYLEYIQDAQNQFEIDRLISIDWHNLPQAYDLVKRVVAQSGEFLVQISHNQSFGTWEFVIDSRSKQRILDDLSKYLNINRQTLLLDV